MTLAELVAEYAEWPEMSRPDMRFILEAANDVMHPSTSRKVTEIPASREIALGCIERLRRAVPLVLAGPAAR